MRFWLIALLLLCGAGMATWWQHRPVTAANGVLVAQAPDQEALVGAPSEIQRGRFTLKTRARFDMKARVLSREDYELDDLAPIAPTDLALGWGRMSDTGVLNSIRISQSNRFYFWYTDDFPIPRREIEESSANMHMIPASDDAARQLRDVRPGAVVQIRGFLVDVRRDDGRYWNTSMTREDTGAGACEVILVESITQAD
ncbi:hypothetical protein FHW69_002164 [Luteibacter sp. Sphag1AF]|uniref:hypothetical protein n=1 Tax=Luteibacter sp. Sphag1AF TaxID=2587031 RepID=UPI0016104B0B|nr:hypothetical protein [Luteibacter sp. Sphag1AF]MBB3227541.1 hypothetical protein [Luteibacter sp. Sphag1AF]